MAERHKRKAAQEKKRQGYASSSDSDTDFVKKKPSGAATGKRGKGSSKVGRAHCVKIGKQKENCPQNSLRRSD